MSNRNWRNLDRFVGHLRSELKHVALKAIAQTQIDVAELAHQSLVMFTPVDTGAMRGSWNVSMGLPDTKKLPKVREKDFYPPPRPGVATEALQTITPGFTVFISNSQPYSEKIEFGGSRKAPNGILRPAVARVVANFR